MSRLYLLFIHRCLLFFSFFFNDTATTEIYTLSLHDALPIYPNALRDYFRDIGRMVLAAEGRKANDSHADCYQYFCESLEIGRAVQQECRDRSRMPSSA